MSPAYELAFFDKDHAPNVRDLAELHKQLLPRSPVVKMGRRFLEECYYRILPQEGLVFGIVAYVDGQPAGFTCATVDPAGFMGAALRRRWGLILWHAAQAVTCSPRRLSALWEGLCVMAGRREKPEVPEGEILSTGVLPYYLSPSFYRSARLRVGDDLLKNIMSELVSRGVQRIRTIIDEDNSISRAYVQRHGWVLDANHVPGWKHPSVAYVWHKETNDYPGRRTARIEAVNENVPDLRNKALEASPVAGIL